MKSEVYWAPISLKDEKERIIESIRKLIHATGFPEKISKNDIIAIKIHFGEEGNRGFIKPEFAKIVSDELKKAGAKTFFTDTNTLYKGKRSNAIDHLILAYEHGFKPDFLGAPVIIADGLLGNAEVKVKIDGKHFKEVPIARELAFCDGIVSLNHFTGHLVTLFGACLKNLGMGGSSRAGKLLQHSSVKPSVKEKKCTGCGVCISWCPTESIKMKGDIAFINLETCIGCGQCLSVCKFDAIYFNWDESSEIVQEKMVEHALGVLKDKKALHLTFLTHITLDCDCMAKDEPSIVEDIGIISSLDSVAIERAGLDLIKKRTGKDFFELTNRTELPENQIIYAEKLGLGSSDYKLIEIW
ncbi:MAG: DUF362 domain-containing protein [Candidatus Aminicenantia bacterium]